MRIIGGVYKNRRFTAPQKLSVRPTTDKTKESIFNILSNYFDFEDLSVMDLFSGTGSMAFEFASRECRLVLAVEKNPDANRFIREQGQAWGMHNLRTLKADVFKFLEADGDSMYDVIFADPPYDLELIESLPDLILENHWLTPGGWFILEHARTLDFSQHPSLSDSRKYGRTRLSVFKSQEAAS
jgi:16S rRNA (guanine(966)-N(2))-methyltransferase RsmD